MPFKIVRNDITRVKADVIVNTANPNPICVSGTDLAIYETAEKNFSQKEQLSVRLQEVILLLPVRIT